MSTHINLKEEKILRVHAYVERDAKLIFQSEKVEIKKRFLCKPVETITQSEGWHGTRYWDLISVKSMNDLIEKGEYKMVDGVPFVCANLVIVTTKDFQYHEYFESDEAMDERLEEIRQETKCDFFCVGND